MVYEVGEVEKQSFHHKAARASWYLPVIVFAISYFTSGAREQDPRGIGMVIGILNLALVSVGFLVGLISLLGIRKHGSRGIIVPALVGLLLNGLVLAVFAGSFQSAKRASEKAEERWQREMEEARDMGVKSFVEYPGWVASCEYRGAIIAAAAVDEKSPFAREVTQEFSARFLVLQISVDNSTGEHNLVLDPSSIRLQRTDGSTVNALVLSEVLSSAKSDREKWLARFGGNIRAAPGGTVLDRFACIPWGTDMRQIDMLAVDVNGQPVTMHGQFLSVEEKKEMYDLNQDSQEQGG